MTGRLFFVIMNTPSCLSKIKPGRKFRCFYEQIGRVAEWSKATVCKTVGLRPT